MVTGDVVRPALPSSRLASETALPDSSVSWGAPAPAAVGPTSTSLQDLQDLYFSYGIDMLPEILRQRGAVPRPRGIAVLGDHQLGFFGRCAAQGGGWETLIERVGARVWGVLYELTRAEWDHLDDWMDARLDGAGTFFHFPGDVTTPDGQVCGVRFFKKDVLGPAVLPSDLTRFQILEGAKLHGLPSTYIAQLEQLDTVASAPPAAVRGGKHRPYSSHGDCRTCDHGASHDREDLP